MGTDIGPRTAKDKYGNIINPKLISDDNLQYPSIIIVQPIFFDITILFSRI